MYPLGLLIVLEEVFGGAWGWAKGGDPVLSLPGGGVGALFTVYGNFFFDRKGGAVLLLNKY